MKTQTQQSLFSPMDRFATHRHSYKKKTYNETQTRREFIDPMLEHMGWDVGNNKNLDEKYKSVVHEDRISIEGRMKAPDYSLRINGIRKFFLEAKRPHINLEEDRESAYQIRRYGWSAHLPLSVLTNFDSFCIYDCRIKPAVGVLAITIFHKQFLTINHSRS